jgi:hypothetical protein
MNSLCSCGGRTPCIQNFCDSIPLAPECTKDVLAVADCIEEVRQAEPGEIEALTEHWKALVRCKFRRAVAALSAPGAVLPVAAPPVAAPAVPVIATAPAPSPEPSEDDEEEAPPAAEAPAPALHWRPKSLHACEVRRIGDKKWRRFASRTDAAMAAEPTEAVEKAPAAAAPSTPVAEAPPAPLPIAATAEPVAMDAEPLTAPVAMELEPAAPTPMDAEPAEAAPELAALKDLYGPLGEWYAASILRARHGAYPETLATLASWPALGEVMENFLMEVSPCV